MSNTVLESLTAVKVTDLHKTYPGDVQALGGLDLAVASGTIFGLLGPNGAGKSTTVKILTTLSKPDQGSAQVAGLDVIAVPDQVRIVMGYVSQKSSADIQATGTENLILQARIHGINRGEARARSRRMMERFGLSEAADRTVKTWSGGMSRRLDIALALMHGPKVLFLDEPTTGLDPQARADLWTEIRRLRDSDGVTILLTTHYLDEADQLADRLAIIDRGKVVTEGTPSELKDQLEGDGLQIDLTTAETAVEATRILSQDLSLSDIAVTGKTIRLRAKQGAEAVPRVLAALSNARIGVAAVTVTRPSLDDVFLRKTGRSFKET